MTLINFYYISNEDKSKIYVGSTKKPLEVRLSEHIISHYNAKYKNKSKLSSFYIIDGNYFKINLIESIECIDNKMKLQKEQEYINEYSGINKNKSYSEFNQLSKESWATYQRNYYNSNNHQYRNYKKDYYQNNKQKIQCRYKLIKTLKQLPFYNY
jgi:hypothetical protein